MSPTRPWAFAYPSPIKAHPVGVAYTSPYTATTGITQPTRTHPQHAQTTATAATTTKVSHMSNNPRYQHVNRQRQRQRWKVQALPCAICGQAIDYTLKAPHPYSFVIDEIIPLKHGGTLTYDNQEPAHWWCNRIKSTHSLAWARRKIRELIQQGKAPQHEHQHTAISITPSNWFN